MSDWPQVKVGLITCLILNKLSELKWPRKVTSSIAMWQTKQSERSAIRPYFWKRSPLSLQCRYGKRTDWCNLYHYRNQKHTIPAIQYSFWRPKQNGKNTGRLAFVDHARILFFFKITEPIDKKDALIIYGGSEMARLEKSLQIRLTGTHMRNCEQNSMRITSPRKTNTTRSTYSSIYNPEETIIL